MESNQEPGISPQNWQESGFPSCTSLDTWRCSISVATVVYEAVHERQRYTTTKILQLPVEPSQNGDGGAFGQLKGRWRVLLRRCECSQENTKKAALACVVLHNICLEKGDTITREIDLAIDPQTGNRRDRATIRELLQMRACDKIPDTDTRARLIREGLIEKLWLEKQGGGVS